MNKQPNTGKSISKTQARFAQLSLYTGGAYVVLLLLLHALEPEYDPTWRFISEYALGPFGLLMNLVFLLYGFSIISVHLAVWAQVKTIPGYIGLGIMALSSIGILLAGLFNTDPISVGEADRTWSGTMHMMGASLDYSPIAMLLLAFSLTKNHSWQRERFKLITAAIICLTLTVSFIGSMPSNYEFTEGTYTALIGRILFISTFLWTFIVARKVLSLYRENSI